MTTKSLAEAVALEARIKELKEELQQPNGVENRLSLRLATFHEMKPETFAAIVALVRKDLSSTLTELQQRFSELK